MRFFHCPVPHSCAVYGLPYLWRMNGAMSVGERVTINSMPSIYGHGQFPRCMFSTSPRGVIEIGDDTFIAGSVLFAFDRIKIGKRVLIAGGCRIIDHNGHPVDMIPRFNNFNEEPGFITIEDDVWLGCDVMVCKGVTIGAGSVIGAKSIVTHDIPPMVFAAGNPAQVIRPLKIGGNA